MKKMRWKCERFNAIRLKDGRLGCSISHLKLLEMAKEKRLDYIVIIEDDIQFTKPEEYNSMLVEFNSFMQQTNLDYDVLMIAGNLRGPVSHLSKFIYRVFNSFVAAGYIVKKHYYDTIIQNYREGIYKLLQNPNSRGMYEVDVYWKKLQAKDRWYIFMPRTVTQLPNFSTIENRYADYNYLMLD
jgi:glycosyl transferase family 25